MGLWGLPKATCTSEHFVRFTCCGTLPHLLPVAVMEWSTCLNDRHRLLDTQFCHIAPLGHIHHVAGMDNSILPLPMVRPTAQLLSFCMHAEAVYIYKHVKPIQEIISVNPPSQIHAYLPGLQLQETGFLLINLHVHEDACMLPASC
eukprot:363096-Chlamydomonas_euryale.AAC.12